MESILKSELPGETGIEGDEPDVVEHTCNPQYWGSRARKTVAH